MPLGDGEVRVPLSAIGHIELIDEVLKNSTQR
jgi:hypothetical protein